MIRKARSRRAAILGTAVLIALLAPLAASPAAGDVDDIVIEPITIPILSPAGQPTTIHIDGTGSIDVTPGTAGQQVDSQCFPMEGNTLCIGNPTAVDPQQELLVGGLSDFLPSGAGDHIAAFGWMVREAIDAVTAVYDLPADGRVERYAGDQIRAYMVTRVIDIFDRYLFGVELTADEQATFEYINREFAERDKKLAQYAHEEYLMYQGSECNYHPPAAPAFVTEPVTLPGSVTAWCSRLHSQLETIVTFAPPIPSVEQFQTWAMYRHADDLGLTGLNSADLQDALGDAQRSLYGFTAVGIAGAAVAAGTAGAVAGLSSSVGGAVAGAIGSQAGWLSAASGVGTLGSVTTVGAIAATGFVAIFILAVIVTVVSIVQLVEHESIGSTLAAQAAKSVSLDPFGLSDQLLQHVPYELREWPTEARPYYRSTDAIARILEVVTRTTTARFGGVYVPDHRPLWSNNATTPDDIQFFVTDSAGSRTQPSITIPLSGVDTTVRFSKGWMVVNNGEGEEAALEFGFVDTEGRTSLATRPATAEGGFTVLTVNPDNTTSSENVDSFQYLDAAGETVTVALVGESTSGLGGPRPSAVGPLTPGRTVILRPNPVDEAGTFDLDRFDTGYDYVWNVSRYDPAAGAWVVAAPTTTAYDTRFIPTAVGNYRASVLMHDTSAADGVDDDVWGMVEFSVSAPTLDATTLTLTDNGTDELQVAAQLANDVPNNSFTLTVTWPGSVSGGARPTSTIQLECIEIDALSCSSVDTALFPELRDALTHVLPRDAALHQGVTVKVVDEYGGGFTRDFTIDDSARPTFEAPAAPPGIDQPGTVIFDPRMTSVQVPIAIEADPNYEIARIAPGDGGALTNFGIVDPEDGLPHTSIPLPGGGGTLTAVHDDDLDEWAIVLRVTAGTADIGSRIIPVVVQQVTGARNTLPLSLDLIAAPEDKYRGALGSDVDPLNLTLDALPTLLPYVLGGKAEWEAYSGDMCVRLLARDFGAPPVDRCGAVDTFYAEDGSLTPVLFSEFDPDGLAAGSYEVSAWIPSGERADASPIGVAFFLRYGPPSISELAWDDATESITFDAAPADPAVPIATYECTVDAAPVDCPDADEGRWSGSALSAGAHTFALSLIDDGGNYTTSSLDFTVGAQPVERIDGATRYDVAVKISQASYPGTAPVVYVTNGENYPDALSAGPAAAFEGGPLLLVLPDEVPAGIAAEIERLDPAKIVVVGGTASVSEEVFEGLAALADESVRIAGADRYEASRNVAEYAFGDSVPLVYLAAGEKFPDALAAGGAAGSQDAPVLLVRGTAENLDGATADLLEELNTTATRVLGGVASVSAGVFDDVNALTNAVRLGGANRYEAARAINADAFDVADHAFLTTGLNFPDALAGSAWAAATGSPLYVVPGTCVTAGVLGDLDALGVTEVTLLGGEASLSPEVFALTSCG